MRFFNTEGPVRADEHYCIPPLERIDLDEVLDLVRSTIYAEVIPRELTWVAQDDVEAEASWYTDARGGLDVNGLLAGFQRFFREHSEHWTQRFDRYREAGPQLLLQAYLQKVVNGGGRVEREYALGRGRVDLLILWPHGARTRRWVVECKVRRDGLERTIREGVAQTRSYIERCTAESGHLLIFDRSGARTWEEKDLPPRCAGGRRCGAGHRLGHVTARATP